MRASLLLIPLTALVLPACGDSGYESSVGQRLELKEGDRSGTTIARERDVSGLLDDQWGAFLERAEGQLGHAPEKVELRGVSIQLDAASSQNVSTLEEALSGEVVAYLKDPSNGRMFDVAKVKDPKGTGRIELDMMDADLADLQQRLLSGTFKVGLRGTTPKAADADFTLALSVTLDAAAL
jgi:hypothetical protein